MRRPHLRKAPIIEAVLDIRVTPSPAYKPELLHSFRLAVEGFLPIYEQTFHIEAQFQVGPTAPAAAKETRTECARLKTSDGGFISMVQPFGINLCKMHPYSRWDDLRDRAKDIWAKYCAEMNPQSVSRVALRYINKIDIDGGSRIEDTFKTYPLLSPTLPQTISAYRLQLQMPSSDGRSTAVINQVFDPSMSAPEENRFNVVFDIDAFQQVQLQPDSAEIWKTFEELHSFKNDIFFESLIESVRKKYE